MRKSRYQKESIKKQRGRWVALWWDNHSRKSRVIGLAKDMTKSDARTVVSEIVDDDAWVFPSERLTTPLSKDNCWNRNIKPKFAKAGLAWANFLVMRRTHATLMGDLGVDGKLVADQCGHTLDVNQNVYRHTKVESRLPAVNQLEQKLLVM